MSDSTRWGRAQWSGSEFAFSEEDSITHSLKTHMAVNSYVYATFLGIQHHLKTLTAIATGVYSIGYGPTAVHPLTTFAEIDTVVEDARLRFSHSLKTSPVISVVVDPATLRHDHILHTLAEIDVQTYARLGIAHFLETRADIATEVYADHLRIGHSLKTSAHVQTIATAVAITEVHLPTIVEVLSPLDPSRYTVGVLNLIPNPAALVTLEGWEPYGGSSLTIDEGRAWFGEHSVALSLPDFVSRGLTIQAAQGMKLSPYGGSILWSGARLATDVPGLVVRIWTRARYTDGTVVDGDYAEGAIYGEGHGAEDWDIAIAPFFPLDQEKFLQTAWIVIEAVGLVDPPVSLFVGAVQMEYDLMMYGPSPTVSLEAA